MAVYNVSKIENWYDDFLTYKSKFDNGYYKDFENSYISKSGDNTVKMMKKKLSSYYHKIQVGYFKIEKQWGSFLDDLVNVDEVLAGNENRGVIKSSIVSSALKNMPELTVYKSSFERFNDRVGAIWSEAKSWIEQNLTFDKIMEFFKRSGATVSTGVISLGEGIFKLGESVVDLTQIVGATISTAVTGLMDFGNWVSNKVVGEERYATNHTERLWVGTRAIVSADRTGSLFDKLYDNTSAGQWLKNNAYGYETTRAIGSEVGEVLGVVGLSILTGGGAAVMYGAAKTAQHTETNWQDENVSTLSGLTKGVIQGASEGAFFAVGMKADKVVRAAASKVAGSSAQVALKKAGMLGGKMLFEAGTAVGQDVGTIATNAIFLGDSFVDANGNTVRLNSLSEKLKYSYDQAGGASGLLASAGTAFVLSAIADRTDVYGKIKTGSAATTATGYLSSAKSNLKKVGSSVGGIPSTGGIKNAAKSAKNSFDVKTSNIKNSIDNAIKDVPTRFKNAGSNISGKAIKLADDAKVKFAGIGKKTSGLTDKVSDLGIVRKASAAKDSVVVKAGDTKVRLKNLSNNLKDKLFIKNANADVKTSVINYSNEMERLRTDIAKEFPSFRDQFNLKEDMQVAKDTVLISKNTKFNLSNYDEGISTVQKQVRSLYGDFDKKLASLTGDPVKISAFTERYHGILNDFDSATNKVRRQVSKAAVNINSNITSNQMKEIFDVSDDYKNAVSSNKAGFQEFVDSYQTRLKDLVNSEPSDDALEVFRRKAKDIMDSDVVSKNTTSGQVRNLNARIVDLSSRVKNGINDMTQNSNIRGLYDEVITDADGNVITRIINGARDATNDYSTNVKNILNTDPIRLGKSQIEDIYSYSSDRVKRKDDAVIYLFNKLDDLKNYKIPTTAKKAAAAVGVTVGLGAIIGKINQVNIKSSVNENSGSSQTNPSTETKKPVSNEDDMIDSSDTITEETTNSGTTTVIDNENTSNTSSSSSTLDNVTSNDNPPTNSIGNATPEEPVPDDGGNVMPGEPVPDDGGNVTPGEPVPDDGGNVTPEEPVPDDGGNVTPEEPVPDDGGNVTPEEPVPDDGGNVMPEEPIPDEGGNVTPEEPVPDDGGNATPEEPVPDDGGTVTPEEPVPDDGGNVTPEEPVPDDGGNVMPEEPIPDEGGTVTPGEPVPDDGGNVTPEEPVPDDGGNVTPEEPVPDDGGNVTPEEPVPDDGGNVTPEEPVPDDGGNMSSSYVKDRISNMFEKISKYFRNIGGRNE